MADLLQVEDLEKAKLHDTFHSEVITGKTGGVAGGSDIDFSTNQVTGQVQATLPKILSQVGFAPASFDFITGGTLSITDRNKAIFYETDGNWYSWGGTLPKTIATASSPNTTGGIAVDAWNVSTSAFMYRDWRGFSEALYADAGITDNGLPDTAIASQRLDAMKAVFDAYGTVAELAAGKFQAGKRVSVTDRNGSDYLVTSGGAANGKNILSAGTGRTAVAIGDITPYSYGYDNTASTTSNLQAWLDSVPEVFQGHYIAGGGTDTSLRINQLTLLNALSINNVRLDSKFIAGKMINIPSAFPFSTKLACYAKHYGEVGLINFDANEYDFTLDTALTITTYYVDNINGINTNDGLTPSTPVRSINKALNLVIAGSSTYNQVLLKGGYYYDLDSWAGRATKKNLVVKQWITGVDARDRLRPVVSTEQANLLWSLESGSVYKAVRSNVNFTVDSTKFNNYGDFSSYKRVYSIVDCQANEGSFFSDAVNVYVHRIGGGIPDGNIHCILKKANGGLGDGTYTFYMEGVDFWGGSLGFSADSRPDATLETVVIKDCKNYYSFANGWEFYGIDFTILQSCVSAYTGADGFNYHSNKDTLTQVTKSIEINCIAYENGVNDLGVTDINNGSTAHDLHKIIRAGGSYQNAQGPVVADVGEAQSYNFCISARDSVRIGETATKAALLISGIKDSWADNCGFTGTLYSISVSGGAKLYCKDINIDGSLRGLESILPAA